jgi:hypothetical protein
VAGVRVWVAVDPKEQTVEEQVPMALSHDSMLPQAELGRNRPQSDVGHLWPCC